MKSTTGGAGRPNSRSGAVGAHPGATDRMVGNKRSRETGPSHPGFLSRAARGVEHGIEGAVDYVRDYQPLSKDLPRKKRR